MQFSPKIENKKQITVLECIQAMELLKNQSPNTDISENIDLTPTQKMFLWCVANKY